MERPPATIPESHPPVESIALSTRHDESEPGPSCPFCDIPTEKVYVSRERWGKHKIVRTEEAPAYRCKECGHLETKIEAIVEFLSAAVDTIAPDDRATASFLRQELAAARRQQELAKISAAR